jgi:hypothetical protein
MPAPDLTDPAQRAAYVAELKQVARGTRSAGLALAFLGLVIAVVRAVWLPAIPAVIPMAVIALALGLLLLGIIRRVRWHLGRMKA